MKNRMHSIQAMVPSETKEQLDALAAERGESASGLAREFITKGLLMELDVETQFKRDMIAQGLCNDENVDRIFRMIKRNIHLFVKEAEQ